MMLQFPEDYFQEESRSGFTVSQTMKRFWAAQMEVLQTTIEICEKHNLIYYAFYGTLLGAVRHKGFIPWDDDIDIAMKREDYEKFLKIAPTELPDGWHIRSIYNETEWHQYHARITNELLIDTSEKRLSRFHGCPFIAGVDCFPLDYYPKDTRDAEALKLLLHVVHAVIESFEYLDTAKCNVAQEEIQSVKITSEEGLSELEKICHISFDHDSSIINQLLRLWDKICMTYGVQDADTLTFYPDYITGKEFLIQKDWLGTTHLPFENMILSTPSDYDNVLKTLYGNYHIFQRDMQMHDYPIYKKELKMLHEMGVWLDVQE